MLVRVNDVENDVFNDEEVETNDVSTILENSAVNVWNAGCRERKG